MASASAVPKAFSVRWLALVPIVAGIVWLMAQHHHGGIKGIVIPFLNVIFCIVSASIAGFVCKRLWIGFAVPIVAGITGVFGIAGQFYGPYGGVLGFLVGCVVLILPFGQRRAAFTHDMSNGRSGPPTAPGG